MSRLVTACIAITLLLNSFSASADDDAESLFIEIGPPVTTALPAHTERARAVRLNRRAVDAPRIAIDLFGETVFATRTKIERRRASEHVWIGHVEGNSADVVIITLRGTTASGLIQHGGAVYRIGFGGKRLLQVDVESLPADDASQLPDGGGESLPSSPGTAADGSIVQDLLVVYTQGACNYAGSCAALEADISTAVTDLNTAYAASQIDITMNLAASALTAYGGTNASTALSDLRGTSDGNMDEVHALRNDVGADIVALIYDGDGCGIGYLGSSANTAFNVTDVPCMVGNRTMAHEIGHNQGAHHDRETAGAGSSTAFNYGYRRCNDSSVDATASPWFRTVMSYSCSGASRVGRFSHPNVNYLGVPTGIDPAVDSTDGAWNAQTLNNSAAYVAGFRASAATTPPAAPTNLSALAASASAIDLVWNDNATDETSYQVERSANGSTWAIIASLGANATSFSDNGLAAETTYHYRTSALNSAGGSPDSNTAMETTHALPAMATDYSAYDSPDKGTVAGTHTLTHVADGTAQAITEVNSGGPKRRRKQSYNHAWGFNVTGGIGGVVVEVQAWVSGSEGALFSFSPDNGSTWTQMFVVDTNAAGTMQTFNLPAGTSGTVLLRVNDAEQANGESVDAVYVDALSITSINEAGEPPAAPTMMAADPQSATSVEVDFMDNADDEFGFEVLRANTAPAGCDAGAVIANVGASPATGGTIVVVDDSAAPEQTYWYWARSYNAAGSQGCSSAEPAETPVAPPATLTMSLHGYKVKGRQHVDVTWSDATASTEIYRDGVLKTTQTDTNGTYTDNIGTKGGGSYVYQACATGGACTAEQTVTF